MLANPISGREKLPYCKHNKIPKVIIKAKYQNDAIRLQDKSKLKKLGSRENRACKVCNERKCVCLWSRLEEKQTNDSAAKDQDKTSYQTVQRDAVKCWNFRYTILEKFRNNHNNLRGNMRHLPQEVPLNWILKPVKNMYISETNLLDTIQRSEDNSLPMSTILYEPPVNLPAKLSKEALTAKSYGLLQDWSGKKEQLEINTTIGKDTKEYFNIRKKRLFEVINAEDQQKKKLIQEEMAKRYNELDELSKYVSQKGEDAPTKSKSVALDMLQNTKLKLVSGNADVEADIPAVDYGNKLEIVETSTARQFDTAKRAIKQLQDSLLEMIPAKMLQYNESLDSKQPQETSETTEIACTPPEPEIVAIAEVPQTNVELKRVSSEKIKETPISKKKPGKAKTRKTRRQKKSATAKKHSTKEKPVKQNNSSNSLIQEEGQWNGKVEGAASNDTLDKPSPPILFDADKLSVAVNQIYIEPKESASKDDDDDDDNKAPVITVTNGTCNIYFHAPINTNILRKSCGYKQTFYEQYS